jgi:hypothetical protein
MHLRISQLPAIAIIVISAAVLPGCRPANYNGTWQGQTSQGKVISFTVTDTVEKRAKLACKLDCQVSGFCPTESSFEGDVNGKLNGSSFSATLDNAVLSGKFDSDTASSGEMKMTTNSPQCGECKSSVTWTAKKL